MRLVELRAGRKAQAIGEQGIGRGAEMGVLIKSAEALERMEKVDTLVVDKTGTLTEGKPKVVKVVPAEGFDEAAVLKFAASVERASEHPLGVAIVQAAAERNIALAPVRGFDAPTGKPHYANQRLDAVPNVFASPVGAAGRVYIPGREGATLRVRGSSTQEI